MIEQGCERISLEASRSWRWWFVVVQQTERGPFVFARGGRTAGRRAKVECHERLFEALAESEAELDEFLRFRPTHALGPHGELIPIPQEPAAELDRARLPGLGSGS